MSARRFIKLDEVATLEAEYMKSEYFDYRGKQHLVHVLRLDDGELVAITSGLALSDLEEVCKEASDGGKHRIRVSMISRDDLVTTLGFRIRDIGWAIARYKGNEAPPRWTWQDRGGRV